MDHSIHLLKKTLTIFGTNILDIHLGMHFNKLPLKLLVSPTLFFWIPFHLAKVVLWAKCTIIPTHLQANMPPTPLLWFTLTLLGLCLLNLTLTHIMFSLSLMTFHVISLLHFFVTKMLLYNIFWLWYPGLRPSLVTCSSLYIQTMGGGEGGSG